MMMKGETIIVTALCLPLLALMMQERPAEVTLPDGTSFACEIADTPHLRNIGLSKHEVLPEGTGMLFIYPEPRLTSFWMPPEMKFNLDMVFMDEQKRIVHIAHDAPPCPDPRGWDCPHYSPDTKVSLVLEVPAGTAKKHGLENGDTVAVSLPDGYQFTTH